MRRLRYDKARPTWANNTIVQRGERRVGELCGDSMEASTSWATEFAEVGNLAKCKFGVSQDLTCTYKRRLYIYIDSGRIILQGVAPPFILL